MFTVKNTFSKAITLVEFEKSGNPQEKYKSGGGILRTFINDALCTGVYVPYMEQVMSETKSRFSELELEIAVYSRATLKLSLEHSNPGAYRKMRILEALAEGE